MTEREELIKTARGVLNDTGTTYYVLVRRGLFSDLVDLAEGHPTDGEAAAMWEQEQAARDLPDLDGLAV